MDHWYAPNLSKGMGRNLSVCQREDSGIFQTFTPQTIADEAKWITEEYEKEYERLRAAYDSVRVDWGVITMAS